ncbi:MAG TPA: TIGR00282 family metallophosphoesterase [Clostridiaceae bacterium]|nr:TIGR00282 family metallophosphoesterase [Clostridiaceae bacterium]
MKILFIGDIFGEIGRKALKNSMPGLITTYNPDFCIANGENAAGGRGITYNTAQEIFDCGIDAITMGNHTWARKEILRIIDSGIRIIRPANFPRGVPGKGRMVVEKNGIRLGVINLHGRIYMDQPVDCPFQIVDRELSYLKGQADYILVDFHAEATSEKIAMGYYVDGRVSCVLGTHTHVQTADEKILENGTAYISDVGMTGPADGVIGVDKELILKKFTLGLPVQHEPAKGRAQINAVIITINEEKNKLSEIKRISNIIKI